MTFDPLAFPGPLARGARDANPSGPVHRLQGWLNLHGLDPGPTDGDFGPRTEKAFKAFQVSHTRRPEPDGRLSPDSFDWERLTAPLKRALARMRGADGGPWQPLGGLGEAVAFHARRWLCQSVGGGPLRELPGNSGPVVEACTRWLAERDRLPCFCKDPAGSHHQRKTLLLMSRDPAKVETRCIGNRNLCPCREYAPDWRLPWCAGWVSTVLKQACESLGVPMPLKGSLSCDELARQAQANEDPARGGFYRGDWAPNLRLVKPGDLFLVRVAKAGDWTHCGVVLEVARPGARILHPFGLEEPLPDGGIRTAEGNTAADGRRNGDRLLERVRPLTGLDFICWRDA